MSGQISMIPWPASWRARGAQYGAPWAHPCSTSHRGQDPAVLERLGITPGLVRLSVGLEDANDLWNDLGQALHALGS